jgi:hypothetical protein
MTNNRVQAQASANAAPVDSATGGLVRAPAGRKRRQWLVDLGDFLSGRRPRHGILYLPLVRVDRND